MLSRFDPSNASDEISLLAACKDTSSKAFYQRCVFVASQGGGRAAVDAHGSKAHRAKGLRANGWLSDG